MSEPIIETVPFHTPGFDKICLTPKTMQAKEAAFYQKIRALHCDRKAASHDCSGRVTLDRNGISLQCPLCGDVRSVYPKPQAPTGDLSHKETASCDP